MNFGVMDDVPVPIKANPTKFLDRYRAWLRLNGYAYETEKTYLCWAKRYIRFHKMKHPAHMGASDISAFLNHGATKRYWSPSSQKTVLNALVNMYSKFMNVELGQLRYQYAKVEQRLPVVLSHQEARQVISFMQGDKALMAKLMYGAGLRVSECIRLRVKDIDFNLNQIIVRNGKGAKDRSTLLPTSLIDALKNRIDRTAKQQEIDILQGYGSVYLPYALSVKYPNASTELAWQYLFPAITLSIDPRTGTKRRHHIHKSVIQKAVKRAATEAKINKPISSHVFRHGFATKLAIDGVHLTQIQKLMGHRQIETTQIYLHIAEQMGLSIKSPIDI